MCDSKQILLYNTPVINDWNMRIQLGILIDSLQFCEYVDDSSGMPVGSSTQDEVPEWSSVEDPLSPQWGKLLYRFAPENIKVTATVPINGLFDSVPNLGEHYYFMSITKVMTRTWVASITDRNIAKFQPLYRTIQAAESFMTQYNTAIKRTKEKI